MPFVGGGDGPIPQPIGDGGYAFDVTLGSPNALAVDSLGSLYIAEANPAVVRRVTF